MQYSPVDEYHQSQQALAQLKSAIHSLLSQHYEAGLKNSEIGRLLGIYAGHVGHEGHIPRTLLAIMEAEGVVEQDSETKRWAIERTIAFGKYGGELIADISCFHFRSATS